MSTRSEPKTVPIFYRMQISRSQRLREICFLYACCASRGISPTPSSTMLGR